MGQREPLPNDSTDPNTFHLVDQITGGVKTGRTFTDNLTDAQVDAGATLTNMNGPPITTATLLTNLISLNSDGNYDNVFPRPERSSSRATWGART